jgi:TolB protein
MQKLFRFALILTLATTSLFAQRKLGEVVVSVDKNTIPVRVSANSPELQRLALVAFGSHGRYRLVASDYAYDIRFSLVGPTQVRLDIAKGRDPAPVFSQVVSGANARNALLRAGDLAVDKTNGLGLRGFFTARLAFVAEGSGHKEICVSDLYLGEAKQITHDRALALSPRWSPDGSRIVYTSFFKAGFPDIFVIDPLGMRRSQITNYRGTNTGGRFSPSGQQIAMVLTGSGSTEIWVTTVGGSPVRKTRSDAVKSSPCWSPDGRRIVFAMEPGPQLYAISASGGTPQLLSSAYSYMAEPDWSAAKPNKIACTVRDGSRYQIAVCDLSTRSAEVVSDAAFDGIEPCWLGDGRHLVYTARDRSSSVLCILDTETHKSTPISMNVGVGAAMQASVWTPR